MDETYITFPEGAPNQLFFGKCGVTALRRRQWRGSMRLHVGYSKQIVQLKKLEHHPSNQESLDLAELDHQPMDLIVQDSAQ